VKKRGRPVKKGMKRKQSPRKASPLALRSMEYRHKKRVEGYGNVERFNTL